MDDIMKQKLENYIFSSDVHSKKGQNSFAFSIGAGDSTNSGTVYNVLSGISLFYFNIHARTLPGGYTEHTAARPLHFNYCVAGRTELLLEDGTYIYLKENDFCISRQASQNESFFPTNQYHGLTLYFDPNSFVDSNRNLLETFNLDFSLLQEIYLNKTETYITEAGNEMKNVLDTLWKLYDKPSLFYMKIYIIELLYLLIDKNKKCPARPCTFYSNTQIKIAKAAEHLLTTNLQKHIPIRIVAENFSVSETSLKNYFKGVYGQNISEYLRMLRMNKAATLLAETKLQISEIANQAGYTKPGRFSAIFKRYYGMSPLEYRRSKFLEPDKISSIMEAFTDRG